MTERAGRDLRLFAQLLRESRQARGMSQHQLAKALGVSQASVSAWEAANAEPEREHVFELEDLLQTGDGGLSIALNYGRVPALVGQAGKKVPSTPQAILSDPSLSDQAKDLLLQNYRLLKTRHRRRQSSGCLTGDSDQAAA